MPCGHRTAELRSLALHEAVAARLARSVEVRRRDLEHVIRATADLADDEEIVVIGSQAILGSHPDAPPGMLRSVEADVYPRSHPERADVIDGAIGEGSPFHDTFGYYARGVGPETAKICGR